MEACDGKAVDKVAAGGKELRRLASGTGDEINTYKCVGHRLAYAVDAVAEERGVVVAVHQLQDLVGPTLQWNMEVGHETPSIPPRNE